MLGSKYFRLLRDTGTAVTECDSALISGANVEYLKAQDTYRLECTWFWKPYATGSFKWNIWKNWWKINISKASQKKGVFAPLAPLRTRWFLNVLPCTIERNHSHVDRLKLLPNDPRAQRPRWVATGRLSTPRISGLWSKPLLTKARVAYLFWCLVYLFARHRAASSERGLYRT
jgi:hypothetical protein